MSLEYFVLDVFTETRLAGNPLAVVLNPGWMNTETMQAVAREMNLSETTFIERRTVEVERREGVRVRIFTTEEELPFAGHPTLGTASLLKTIAPECVVREGEVETVRLALNVGVVPVRFAEPTAGDSEWPLRGEMTQRDPEFGEVLDKATVAELTGLKVEDFDPALPIQIVSTGTAFAIVGLRTADGLAKLEVRQKEATAFLRGHGARWFYVGGPLMETVVPGATPEWQARMQFHGGEDPATGSAAGCAISHLVHWGAVASGQQLHLRQGVEMGRPSGLFLSADFVRGVDGAGRITNVRVGGSTILVARGQLFLP